MKFTTTGRLPGPDTKTPQTCVPVLPLKVGVSDESDVVRFTWEEETVPCGSSRDDRNGVRWWE